MGSRYRSVGSFLFFCLSSHVLIFPVINRCRHTQLCQAFAFVPRAALSKETIVLYFMMNFLPFKFCIFARVFLLDISQNKTPVMLKEIYAAINEGYFATPTSISAKRQFRR